MISSLVISGGDWRISHILDFLPPISHDIPNLLPPISHIPVVCPPPPLVVPKIAQNLLAFRTSYIVIIFAPHHKTNLPKLIYEVVFYYYFPNPHRSMSKRHSRSSWSWFKIKQNHSASPQRATSGQTCANSYEILTKIYIMQTWFGHRFKSLSVWHQARIQGGGGKRTITPPPPPEGGGGAKGPTREVFLMCLRSAQVRSESLLEHLSF